MSYHTWCWIVRGIGLAGGAFWGAGVLSDNNRELCALGVVFLIVGLIVAAWKLRCPKCRRRIPERINMKIEMCPYCGEKL